nr:uncharacterized protein LOC119176990 [Rhipicephalus microplus]
MGLPQLDVWFAGADDELPSFSFALSLSFLNSPCGILTIAEIVTGILTFALSYSSRYVLLQAFGLVFYLSGGISLLALEAGQSVAIAAGVFAIISSVLHGLHAVFVYLKRKK